MDSVDVRTARLQAFFKADPANTDLACELADALFAQGRYPEGRDVLGQIANGSGVPASVRFRLGRAALVLGDYARAEATYRALIESGQDGMAVWHDLAFSQLCQRQAGQALASLETAEARFGESAMLSILRARVAMMQADFARAVVDAGRAIELDADNATALGVRALALLDSGESDAAFAAAQSCLTSHPDQHEALLVSGSVALMRQDTANAETQFALALEKYPNSGRALLGYGECLMLRGSLPEARTKLEHAARVMPDHIGTWHALAWSQLLQGDQDAAGESYQQAYRIDRNFGDTHGGLALIDALRGNFEAAERGIARALRLDPDAMTARYASTLVREARGDTPGAEAMMAELLRKRPSTEGMQVREFAARLKSVLGAQTR